MDDCVYLLMWKVSEVTPSNSAADSATASGAEQTDDDAPTPKHWSSDWDPTLNSLLSAYVHYTAC